MQYCVCLNGKMFYHDDVKIYTLQYFLTNVCPTPAIVLPLLGLITLRGVMMSGIH